MDFRLTRYNVDRMNLQQMDRTLKKLVEFSRESFNELDGEKKRLLSSIINFMDRDGSFRLIDTYEVESDARVRYCYYSSYYCTGILMKVLLQNKDFFTGKEDIIMPKALEFCCGRGLKGHGYDDLTQQIEIMDFFISCGLKEFLEKYSSFCPKFSKMINFIVDDYAQCIEANKFTFYFGENHEQDFKRIIAAMGKENRIWYVCYGSNMLQERFEKYIKGGVCEYNGKSYTGCTDKTFPNRSLPVEIPYDMYLGKNSPSWGGSVAFLDLTKKGKAYGRAYLVTQKQFAELQNEEGVWYGKKVPLDPIEGLPAFTITNEAVFPFVSLSPEYMFVLAMGLKETYPEMPNEEVFRYLKDKVR